MEAVTGLRTCGVRVLGSQGVRLHSSARGQGSPVPKMAPREHSTGRTTRTAYQAWRGSCRTEGPHKGLGENKFLGPKGGFTGAEGGKGKGLAKSKAAEAHEEDAPCVSQGALKLKETDQG